MDQDLTNEMKVGKLVYIKLSMVSKFNALHMNSYKNIKVSSKRMVTQCLSKVLTKFMEKRCLLHFNFIGFLDN